MCSVNSSQLRDAVRALRPEMLQKGATRLWVLERDGPAVDIRRLPMMSHEE